MAFNSIDDIYAYNDAVRQKLSATVSDISPEVAQMRPTPDRWSVAEILEHVAIVENSIGRICQKLIGKAKSENALSDGTFYISPEFISGCERLDTMKVEAPERVLPVGGVSIAESLALLESSRAVLLDLRDDLNKFDIRQFKFPHPYLGEISAIEWLILAGGHESSHLKQIKAQINP